MTKQEGTALKTRTHFITRGTALVAILLIPLVVMAGENSAMAGTYSVQQCDYEASIAANSFSWQSSGAPAPIQHANSGCTEFGLAIRTSGSGSAQTYPESAYGGYIASAPSGTVFTQFSGVFGTLTNCCVTGLEAYAEAKEFASGSGRRDEIFRGSLGETTWSAPSGLEGPVRVDWSSEGAGYGAEGIGYFLGCGDASGCAQSVGGDVRLRGRSFEFVLDDLIGPTLVEPTGDLLSEGWVRGVRELSIGAEDQGGGLVGITAELNDFPVINSPSVCSLTAEHYVELRPCPLTRDGNWTVDTAGFSDGPTTLRIRVDDVGGSADEWATTVKIDNTPPAAPSGVAVDGGERWQNVNDFAVSWDSALESNAPVSVVHYELCPIPADVCQTGTSDGSSSESMQAEVPSAGIYKLRLWFEDAAGNANADSASEPVVLKFDDGIPGVAQVQAPGRWIGAAQAENPMIALDLESGTEPISGVAGYSVTTDGSYPDDSTEATGPTPSYSLGTLTEGITLVRAVAVSGAGTPSTSAGEGLIKVDRTAPAASAEGILDTNVWQTRAPHVEISSSDQPGLSGVVSAPLDRPPTEGGYIALRLDNSVAEEVRGDRATIDITTDGHHTLSYRAFDVAGNGSVEKEVEFKVDRTAPVGAFRALDVRDPRALRVDVEDATSGVADGVIEYRREGTGGFKPMATNRAGGVLTARLDDQALAPGRYELRAVVTDVAGNEAVIASWADGSGASLAMPLRLSANLTAARTAAGKSCAKAAKKRRGKARRKPTAHTKCRQKKAKRPASLELAHGKRAASNGRLTTTQGAPIAGAPIVVEGRPRSGGAFVRLGTTHTDATGHFRFSIPAGPSRTVRYRYDGTNTVQPASTTLATKVRAAARLKVSRRRLRNGQAVRFTGRLLGKPIPTAGKVVALQAKVGREWRTFATPRANRKGVFRHRYRFTATTGLRRYEFRAVVAREAAYPYEKGVSRTVKVVVRGR